MARTFKKTPETAPEQATEASQEQAEPQKDEKVTIIEREVTLSLINEKVNYLIEQVLKLVK